MFLTETELGQSLVKNAQVSFSKGAKLAPTAGRKIFNVRYVNEMNTENDTYVYDPIARRTAEGADYHISNPVKGFKLLHRQGKFTDSFESTKEVDKFTKYDVANELKRIQGLGTSGTTRLELNLQLAIGMGAGASYEDIDGDEISTKSADGKNHFATDHFVKSGLEYSNIQAIAFGRAGLEAHENLMRKMPNHEGNQTMKVATAIYMTRDPANQNLAKEYTYSTGHVEDANQGINAYKGKYELITMELLDSNPDRTVNTAKAKYWGLVVAGSPELQCEVSQDPTMYAPQMIVRNRNLVTQTDLHFSQGIRDATDITLSPASAS